MGKLVDLDRDLCESYVEDQIRTLFEAGADLAVIKMARLLLAKLPDRVLYHSGCEIALLLVMPFKLIPLQRQLEMVQYRPKGVDRGPSQPAFSFLEEKNLRDVQGFEKVPRNAPYIVTDVDSGAVSRYMSPNWARQRLKEMRRNPVTVAQGLALAIHTPGIFHETNIYLAGSEIKDPKTGKFFTPDLWVYADKIKMKRDSGDDVDSRWCTPSYESLITI